MGRSCNRSRSPIRTRAQNKRHKDSALSLRHSPVSSRQPISRPTAAELSSPSIVSLQEEPRPTATQPTTLCALRSTSRARAPSGSSTVHLGCMPRACTGRPGDGEAAAGMHSARAHAHAVTCSARDDLVRAHDRCAARKLLYCRWPGWGAPCPGKMGFWRRIGGCTSAPFRAAAGVV